MGQRFNPRQVSFEDRNLSPGDDAAAVYPDHDIVTRHLEGPLTIGDFVSAFAEGAEGHGGLPTYLRITLQQDASKLRKLMTGRPTGIRVPRRTAH
ncbi:MAG: hypothetical protein JSR99_13550 [Proteobacteria bacterium]|nr:hypothetical protein [Pseudomonadota bacterium]